MQPFVLHAHFYQPERLNPWTSRLDPEPSAAPDRDWNERILRECYAPNGAARIHDDGRGIRAIVNNYERLSFNFGPTLLSWMERTHPRTYARILDGDWRSRVRTGHGNALAQAYNHMILPLANDRDRATQIRWGLADFRSRFRRDAEGMWLPETAVNPATIDALIDGGVTFTVLAPHQAARARPSGQGHWHDTGHSIDTSRPYRHLHSDGSGRSVAVFFYDSGLAHSIAFDSATKDAGVLLDRLRSAADARGGGLVHAAVDGETFGHHHPFGELGLAYVLHEAAHSRGLEPISYGAYLERNPPTDDVEVVDGEGTAWSCAHGVGRWYRDCGCSTGGEPGWDQAWRTPLRAALDGVRDAAAEAMDTLGGDLLKDPWAARDDYLGVRLGESTQKDFLDRHGLRSLSDSQVADLWVLMEAQRHAMVMYTSCGWFFADVSGIETVYVLRSAARVLDLLDEAGVPGREERRARLLDTLGQARSNKSDVGTGADIWRREVEPTAVTPTRIAAHVSLLGLVKPLPEDLELAGRHITIRHYRGEFRGHMGLSTSRVLVTERATGRRRELAAAAVHLGGLDFFGTVAPSQDERGFDAAASILWDAFPHAPVAHLIRMVDELLPGQPFGLEDMLAEGRQEVVGAVFADLTSRFREHYSRLYEDHERILEMLVHAGYELPRDLRAAAELTLSAELEQQVAAIREHPSLQPEDFGSVRNTIARARRDRYAIDLSPLGAALSDALRSAVESAVELLTPESAEQVADWLALASDLDVKADLFVPQELVYDAAVKGRAGRLSLRENEAVARLGALVGLSPVAWTP
ncbi:MAG TPA: DUF3536 domain-containing protein [Egibacteraceae bacterium]|nr:DUF3536 domain-containing protein [Egibacteraceae bacterium]